MLLIAVPKSIFILATKKRGDANASEGIMIFTPAEKWEATQLEAGFWRLKNRKTGEKIRIPDEMLERQFDLRRALDQNVVAAIRLAGFLLIIAALVALCISAHKALGTDEGYKESEAPAAAEFVFLTAPATMTRAEISEPSEPTAELESIGTFELTAYCPCEKCCGYWATVRPRDAGGNPIVYTASGEIAEAGTTIAVDPEIIPIGAEIQINGHTYIAQDTGSAIKGHRIDVYHDDHASARNFGRQTAEVYIKADQA